MNKEQFIRIDLSGSGTFADYKVRPYIPMMLRDHPSWVLWKKVDRKGKPTKVPFSAKWSGQASSTDPNSWTTFEAARKVYSTNRDRYNGLGFVIDRKSGLVFVDVDGCIDEEGKLDKRGALVLNTLRPTFCEVSQSGHGLHFFVIGTIDRSFNNRNVGIEMYDSGRFCAMTGQAISSHEPAEDQEGLDILFNQFKTREKPTAPAAASVPCSLDDSVVIEKAMAGNPSFKALYQSGDFASAGLASHSEADLRLCGILAFWTDRDPAAIDRIFRSSALMRAKWNRADYRSRTLALAIAGCDESLTDYRKKKEAEDAQTFIDQW